MNHIFYMRKRLSFERVQAKSMKIIVFTNLTLAFEFHELWQILKNLSQSLSRFSYLFTNMKIWQAKES